MKPSINSDGGWSTVDDDIAHARRATVRSTIPFMLLTALYTFVAFFYLRPSEGESGLLGIDVALDWGSSVILLAAMILGTLVTLVFLPRQRSPERLESQGVSGPDAVTQVAGSYTIRAAAAESVSLVGFVLTFHTGQLPYVLVAAFFTILLLVIMLIRRHGEFEEIRRHYGH